MAKIPTIFPEIKTVSSGIYVSKEMRNAHWLSHFTTEMKAGLYTDDFQKVLHIDSFDLLMENMPLLKRTTSLIDSVCRCHDVSAR